MKLPKIIIDENEIVSIAKKNHINELYLFGSILRNDFNENRDVDILVVFDKNSHYSYFDIFDIKEKFKNVFKNKEIDIIEKDSLKNPFRRTEILRTARKIYGAE